MFGGNTPGTNLNQTVTFFWVLSDFLSGKNKSLSITSELMQGRDASDLVKMASDPGQPVSDAALWMLLLLRLTKVTTDDRLELRNSKIQLPPKYSMAAFRGHFYLILTRRRCNSNSTSNLRCLRGAS